MVATTSALPARATAGATASARINQAKVATGRPRANDTTLIITPTEVITAPIANGARMAHTRGSTRPKTIIDWTA